MTMRLSWLNRLDVADLATDSEVASLPVSNVRHPYLSRQWRTQPGVTTSFIQVDLNEPLACDVMALTGTNLTSSAALRIRASNGDPTAAAGDVFDSGTFNPGVKPAYRAAYAAFDSATARYWRIDISDAAVAEAQLRIGRAWLGPAWTPTENREYGWGKVFNDMSRRTAARSGAQFIDVGARFRTVQFSLAYMDATEMQNNAWECARVAGVSKDVLAIFEPDGDFVAEDSILGLVDRADPIVQEQLRVFRMRYSITERVNNEL